jgi:hypothetical protein
MQALTEYVNCVPPDACPPTSHDQLLSKAGAGVLSLTPFLLAISATNGNITGDANSGTTEGSDYLFTDTSSLGRISMRIDAR